MRTVGLWTLTISLGVLICAVGTAFMWAGLSAAHEIIEDIRQGERPDLGLVFFLGVVFLAAGSIIGILLIGLSPEGWPK